MRLYVLIVRSGSPSFVGPFEDEQKRHDYACALWFQEPARGPYEKRGKPVPFNRRKDTLHYVAVSAEGRLFSPRDVTVGDLAKGAGFPK